MPEAFPGARAAVTASETDVLATGAAGGKAIRGGLLRTCTYVVTLALGLISVPLMTDHLGVERFGFYVTVSSIVFIIGGFSEAGLTNLGIREYSVLDRRERGRYLQVLAGLRLALTATGVTLAALFALVSGQPRDVVVGTAIAGLGMFLGLAQYTYAIPLTVRLQFGWLSALDIVRQVALVLGIVVCVALGTGLVPFFWANVASGGAVLVATLMLVRSDEGRLRPVADFAAWKRIARYATPYALAAVAALIYFRLGVILLGYVSSDSEVGLYGTAFRITEVLAGVPYVIVSAAFPILAHAARDDGDRLRYAIQKLFEGSAILGGFVVIGLVVGAHFAIDVVAPIDQFEGAVPLLRVQGCALLFTFVQATFAFALLSMERFREFLVCNVVALVVAAAGTLALGPSMGGMGAAIAITAAEAALAISYLIVLGRGPGMAPSLRVVPKILVAGAAAGSAALLSLPAVVEAALAGGVYVAVCVALRAVPEEFLTALMRRDPV